MAKKERPLMKFRLYDGMRFERYQEAYAASGKDPQESAMLAEDSMYEWIRRHEQTECTKDWYELNQEWLAYMGYGKGQKRGKTKKS